MKELALNILDIVQNSIRANSKLISIRIEESETGNSMNIYVCDDGKGIEKEMLKKVTDPYTTSRTTRKVGMGLAFMKQLAEMTGGTLKVSSQPGTGTEVEASFQLNHLDRQPIGDIAGVFKILVIANPEIEFVYEHKTDTGLYRIDTREVKKILDCKKLDDNDLMQVIKRMIFENLLLIGVYDFKLAAEFSGDEK